MKSPALATALSTALLLSAIPATGNVEASTLLQRCQAADGTTIFTDQPCTAFDATPKPLSAQTLNRIASIEAREARRVAANNAHGNPSPLQALDTGMALAFDEASIPARRPVSAGCATSPEQLALDLRGALALGDVNRVAESYAWMGLDNQQGQRILDRLGELTKHAVVNAQYYGGMVASVPSVAMQYDEATGSWVDTAPPTPRAKASGEGLLQLTLANDGGRRQVVDFTVRQFSDCWFVQY